MSSSLVQVTVVPAFTVSCCGSKVKLSIVTAGTVVRSGRAARLRVARRNGGKPSTAAAARELIIEAS